MGIAERRGRVLSAVVGLTIWAATLVSPAAADTLAPYQGAKDLSLDALFRHRPFSQSATSSPFPDSSRVSWIQESGLEHAGPPDIEPVLPNRFHIVFMLADEFAARTLEEPGPDAHVFTVPQFSLPRSSPENPPASTETHGHKAASLSGTGLVCLSLIVLRYRVWPAVTWARRS